MKRIEIDKGSGFCFGVTTAIKKAEEELKKGGTLYCLGDIVHNGRECERLKQMGLITINHDEFRQLHNVKVLLRAHGEPPETYETARKNDIEIIDATCPVVLQLQKRIKKEYAAPAEQEKQIVIYGKNGHAEVLGLVGQTEGKAIVIESLEEAKKLDFTKDIRLYSQTTKSLDEFNQITEYIRQHIAPGVTFQSSDTICRQVANRMPKPHLLRQRKEKLQRQNPVQRVQESKPQLLPRGRPRRDRLQPGGTCRHHRHLWSHLDPQMAHGSMPESHRGKDRRHCK